MIIRLTNLPFDGLLRFWLKAGCAGILAACVAIALSACVPQPPSQSAVDEAEIIAQSLPSLESLHEKAALELQTQRPAQAQQTYTAILKREPNDLTARLGLAEAQLQVGDLEAAAGSFAAVLAYPELSNEQKALASQGAGLANLGLEQNAKAASDLKRAVQLDPTLWRARLGLGRLYDQDQNWQEAEKNYVRATESAPEEPSVYNNHGLSRMAVGDLAYATILFQRALMLDPTLDAADTNLRLSLAFQGRYDEAISGIEVAKRPAAFNDVGYAAIIRKDFAQARRYLLRAIDESPSFFEPAWANLRYLDALEKQELRRSVGPAS